MKVDKYNCRLKKLLYFGFFLQLLEEIEEHLGVTIPQIETDMVVPVDEFDGKVVYGAKRSNTGELLFIFL